MTIHIQIKAISLIHDNFWYRIIVNPNPPVIIFISHFIYNFVLTFFHVLIFYLGHFQKKNSAIWWRYKNLLAWNRGWVWGKFIKFSIFFKTYFREFWTEFSILFSDYERQYVGKLNNNRFNHSQKYSTEKMKQVGKKH